MTRARLKLLSKFAGRIPVEKYQAQVFDIINKVQGFLDAKRHHNLSGTQTVSLGILQFDVNGKQAQLEVKVCSDSSAYFEAGLQWPTTRGQTPSILINLHSFQFNDPMGVMQTLKPLIVHELTHFLDYQYNPVSHALPEEGETKSPFFQDFFKLLDQSKAGIDWKDLSSKPKGEIKSVAKAEAFKIFKSKAFKELLAAHQITANQEIIGKLLNVIYQIYLDDLVFYKTTGGDLFGIENSPEARDLHKKIKNKARDIYFNSEAEVLAYTNQIIDEVQTSLREEKGAVTLINIVQGKESISVKLDPILEKSETFQDVKSKWSSENLNKLYYELGVFLSKTYRKMTAQDKANKLGLQLSAQEHLIYRYLIKLMDENPEKLSSLIQNETFRKDNINTLKYLKNDLDFRASLQRMEKALEDLKI